MVNSSANTVANGSSVTASDQQILPDEMRGVAREVQAHVPRRELLRSAGARGENRQQDQQAAARADRQDFKDVELLAERADGQRARPRTRAARRSSTKRPGRVAVWPRGAVFGCAGGAAL